MATDIEGDLPFQHIKGFDVLLVSVQWDGLTALRCLFDQAKLTVGSIAGGEEVGAGLAHPAHFHNKAPLVTTIINKFDTALKNSKLVDEDPNIFVLVDESHRTQTGRYGGHSQFAAKMRRLLPKACYLGFTGTPLLKKGRTHCRPSGG
ncbi:hypothetical protein GGR20_003686 [Devosia subaequoris]|uniref:SWI2/SNF2 ATPase domain-containing protein n=1 Tax=Devosia subaequoris TaxID=395930 RepID=A0A7W6NDN4_9HYPH|nr:hypothetical protein [Devosia subaequoris]